MNRYKDASRGENQSWRRKEKIETNSNLQPVPPERMSSLGNADNIAVDDDQRSIGNADEVPAQDFRENKADKNQVSKMKNKDHKSKKHVMIRSQSTPGGQGWDASRTRNLKDNLTKRTSRNYDISNPGRRNSSNKQSDRNHAQNSVQNDHRNHQTEAEQPTEVNTMKLTLEKLRSDQAALLENGVEITKKYFSPREQSQVEMNFPTSPPFQNFQQNALQSSQNDKPSSTNNPNQNQLPRQLQSVPQSRWPNPTPQQQQQNFQQPNNEKIPEQR